MTFPDENMARAAALKNWKNIQQSFHLDTSEAEFINDLHERNNIPEFLEVLNAAFTDYRTRTGIDVADVVAKLSAGTHVVVPVEPTPNMISAAWALMRDRWPRGPLLGPGSGFKECMIAMIRAAQEKVE